MAKKKKRSSELNVAQAIRDYVDGHPDVKPKPGAEELSSKLGVQIEPQYFSSIKSTYLGAKGGKKKGASKRKAGGANLEKQLLKAKELADEMGGVDKLKQTLDLIEKIRH